MTEFTEVMRHWKRMCQIYSANEETSCEDCPMLPMSYDGRGCDAIYSEFADHADWARVAACVMEWAAEHPEPVYPTWGEWFLHTCQVAVTKDGKNDWDRLLEDHIPRAIADKLGIEPKEGNNADGDCTLSCRLEAHCQFGEGCR